MLRLQSERTPKCDGLSVLCRLCRVQQVPAIKLYSRLIRIHRQSNAALIRPQHSNIRHHIARFVAVIVDDPVMIISFAETQLLILRLVDPRPDIIELLEIKRRVVDMKEVAVWNQRAVDRRNERRVDLQFVRSVANCIFFRKITVQIPK